VTANFYIGELHMSAFETVSFKAVVAKVSPEELDEAFKEGINVRLRDGKTLVTLKYADAADSRFLAHLVQEQRLANDTTVVPGYIESAVVQRDEQGRNFFETYWDNKFAANTPNAKTIKAVINGTIVGVSRFEAYASSDSADIVAAIRASKDPSVKPSFDLKGVNKNVDLDAWLSETWGEGHQFYIDKDHHGKGLGDILFDCATVSLGKMGCNKMLINALSGNHAALSFYKHKGAICGAKIVEHNTRNNRVFTVPCNLLAVNCG
jgi:GNAT superfamily N-acetyltransferase